MPATTTINSYLRRVDLLAKLLAPLFVSLLTTTVSYTFASAFLLGFAAGSMVFEFLCTCTRASVLTRETPKGLSYPPRSSQGLTSFIGASLRFTRHRYRASLRSRSRRFYPHGPMAG